jgi:hypothetical protein
MDPDVIRWSNDDVMGDREVIEICPAPGLSRRAERRACLDLYDPTDPICLQVLGLSSR